ncbi:phage tail tip lysozyme [Methylobacterium radiotolerans]|uniref:phage tail tip lysozyme n=1 Tax=Methylobacterium radiotolerans TaxID=31998 RepID=UPI00339234B2
MADDKLRIVATVEDQFTGPLSKLEKGLKHVGEETAKQGATWKKDWAGVREEVGKFQGVLRGFDPIFAAVGVTGFGAAMSLTGMVTALKGFSGQTRDLSQMGRQIGMTVDQLRTLGSLGEKFGVSADAMRGAIGQFATNMVDLRQRWGQVYGELKNMNLGSLAEDLVNAPSMEAAVETAMKALQNIPDSMKAARVSTLIFGTPDMATISRNITGKISDALKQTQADIGHLDKETEEAARRFEEHFSRIGRAAEKAKLNLLGPALRNVAGALDQMDAAAADPEGEQLKRLKESRQSADTAVKAAPYGTGWYFERQRDSLDQEIARLEKRRAAPAATAVEDKLGSAKAELDYYQNRRLTKDPGREKELAEEIRRLTEELRRLRENGSGTPTVQQQSFSGSNSGGGSLIQKAAWGGFGSSGGAAIPSYGAPGGGDGGGNGGAGGGSRSRSDGGSGFGGRSGSGGGSPDGSDRAVVTPRGSGRGNPRGARTGEMMRYAMDQLRREGVPEGQLRQAAAHLVGQAHMESGLDPNKIHDGGTGYGIYGARDPKGWGTYRGARRSDMVRWLEANGYARNSAEGQMREMVHQAMSGKYPRTKAILMGRGTGDVEADTNAITKEFESPAVINRRSGAVRNALRIGPDEPSASIDPSKGGPLADKAGPLKPTVDDPDLFPNGAPRVLKPNSMKDAPGVTMEEAERRREAAKSAARRPEVLADPTDERRQAGKPFYSEEDDQRAARDLGIALRARRAKADAPAPKEKVGDALMDRFYGKGAASAGQAMQMPGGVASGRQGLAAHQGRWAARDESEGRYERLVRGDKGLPRQVANEHGAGIALT